MYNLLPHIMLVDLSSLSLIHFIFSYSELNEEPYYAQYTRRRLFVYKLVTNKYFDIAVSIIIFLNVISMAVEHYQMSEVSYDYHAFFTFRNTFFCKSNA